MALILNPYDLDLDLTDKDDRKLFAEASQGLAEKSHFDGKRETFAAFSKLMEKEFDDVRIMKCLSVPTKWDVGAATVAGRRIPTAAGKVDFFSSYTGERADIEEYCNLVWSNTTFGANTPRYFDIFNTAPNNTADLSALRHQRQLRHIIMGNKIWKSLDPAVWIEYSGNCSQFKRGGEYDGPLLWDFIRRRVNPSTTVGASKLKEELETTKLSKFGDDIVSYNTWFDEMRTMIIRDEGEDKYSEYLRNLFKAYLTCADEEFVSTIKDERRKWMQGKLPNTYDYTDLMTLGLGTFNNLDANGEWKGGKNKISKSSPSKGEEKNFLALATDILQKLKDGKVEESGSQNTSDGGIRLKNGRELKAWRFHNPNGEKTKTLKDGTVMKWCVNDCHPKPMWCGRSNCLNRKDYAEKFGGRKKQDGSPKKDQSNANGPVISEDFKIALAAMTSDKDFQSLKSQFF